MAGSHQMRDAWSRRTDEELLHAHFLEELSPEGRDLVRELVIEKFGPIEAYLESFARAQGEVVSTFPVGGCEVDTSVKQQRLPVMWGHLVLATKGVGFIPGGLEERGGMGDSIGVGLGGLAGELASALLAGMGHTRNVVENLADHAIPLPLLAHIEPSAVWLPRDQFDAVQWGPDFGEVLRAGMRLCCLEPAEDAEALVCSWAEAHDIPLTALDPSPLLR